LGRTAHTAVPLPGPARPGLCRRRSSRSSRYRCGERRQRHQWDRSYLSSRASRHRLPSPCMRVLTPGFSWLSMTPWTGPWCHAGVHRAHEVVVARWTSRPRAAPLSHLFLTARAIPSPCPGSARRAHDVAQRGPRSLQRAAADLQQPFRPIPGLVTIATAPVVRRASVPAAPPAI